MQVVENRLVASSQYFRVDEEEPDFCDDPVDKEKVEHVPRDLSHSTQNCCLNKISMQVNSLKVQRKEREDD